MTPANRALAGRVQYLLIAGGAALAAAAVGVAVVGGGGWRTAEAGADHTIFVNDNQFCGVAGAGCAQPYSIQIDPGETVQWLDGEPGVSHTVTECTANWASCPAPGGFDSGLQSDPAGPYVSQPFPDAGTVYFRCQLHGNSMRGFITVGSAATATPSPSPAPSLTSTPTASASPTATAPASPSATPGGGARSDVNCDGVTDGADVIALLLYRADAGGVVTGGGSCPPVGTQEGEETKGDLNCDGAVDARDAVVALRVWAGLSLDGFLPEGCPAP